MIIDSDIAVRYNVRVRELNRQYEKFNNQDFDNGVYHKYAYNQTKSKDGKLKEDGNEDEGLKEEEDVDHGNYKRTRKTNK